MNLCQFFNFLIIFYSFKVFPLCMLESLCESIRNFINPTDYFSCFYLFLRFVNVLFILSIRKFTKDFILLFEDVKFSRIFVCPLSKYQPTNLEILSIANICGISFKKVYSNWIDIFSNCSIQSHIYVGVM